MAIVGCVYYEAIGTGHHLIEELLHHRMAWYAALILLALRSLLVILSNDVGATGGLFTPILSFGALLGSVLAECAIALGLLDESYLMLMVVVGMVSFFAAAVRTPLTGIAFAVEALSGFGNLLPILLAVLVSYAIVEVVEANSINEIAMEREIHKERHGKERHVVDVTVEAMHGSFAIGKAPRDILWPASCTVLSVKQEGERHFYTGGPIEAGDILRLNFTTYDPERTARELCAIVGEQEIYDEDVLHHEVHATEVAD